ncbi:Sco1/SenC family protein, partial [Pseudomonas syringae pv. actinidiae ICMP 19070]
MTYRPPRREVVTGLSLLSLGLLTGCGNSNALPFKHGKDMSNEIVGRNFRLKDSQGNVKTLSSFRGLMPMIFFGFTQCPAICPTALARAAQIRKLMGEE